MKHRFALAVVLASASAHAGPSQEDKEQAAALVVQGTAASQAGDHETAAQLYHRARRLNPDPALLPIIASEYRLLNEPRWALTYFCEYLAADPNGRNAANARTQARALYVELGGTPNVKDADLCKPIIPADSATKPSNPAKLGKSATATTSPPAGGGDTLPSAGADTPTVPPRTTTAPPITTSAPQPPADEPHEQRGMSTWQLAGIGVAGLGLIAFGVGAYYGWEARQIDNELTNHPVEDPWPVDLRDREARGESYNRRAIVLMVSGGAMVALGGAALVFMRPHPSASDQLSFTPIVSPDNVGVAAAGRF